MTPHDHEERELAEIEHHLAEEDPGLARRLAEFHRATASLLVTAVLGVLMLLPAGLVTMVVGVQTNSPVAITGGVLLTALVPALLAWYLHRRH